MAISLAYVSAAKDHNVEYAIAATAFCIFFSFLGVHIIERSQQNLEILTVTIKKVKSADKEAFIFFVAYALPFIFKGESAPEISEWLMASGMLLFVLWSTHTLQINPVLGAFGYHFYEVETAEGITYLLIAKRKINNIVSVKQVVQLSEYGLLEVPKKKDE